MTGALLGDHCSVPDLSLSQVFGYCCFVGEALTSRVEKAKAVMMNFENMIGIVRDG